jgi:hypothetical protein
LTRRGHSVLSGFRGFFDPAPRLGDTSRQQEEISVATNGDASDA